MENLWSRYGLPGNCHGQSLRRSLKEESFRLTDEKLNGGLPAMLVDHAEAAGLNPGLMMPQYTAASLVLENQTLAHPDSVHSLPTIWCEQEDHNAKFHDSRQAHMGNNQ
jgi:histidine ammonia-lyase